MGGSLEGVCAAGLADAIVDLRETGTSLAQNRLRVLANIAQCEALFVHDSIAALGDLTIRISAVLEARQHRYVMMHLPPSKLGELRELFSGLAAPTVLPLSEREDLVAVHLVIASSDFWSNLAELRTLGATGIVAQAPDALLR
jgi:ATP phosphoribosyltransferase